MYSFPMTTDKYLCSLISLLNLKTIAYKVSELCKNFANQMAILVINNHHVYLLCLLLRDTIGAQILKSILPHYIFVLLSIALDINVINNEME